MKGEKGKNPETRTARRGEVRPREEMNEERVEDGGDVGYRYVCLSTHRSQTNVLVSGPDRDEFPWEGGKRFRAWTPYVHPDPYP